LFDVIIGRGIIKVAFPQHPAKFPGPLPLDEFLHRFADGWTFLRLTSNPEQLIQGCVIYVHCNSHATQNTGFDVYFKSKRCNVIHFYSFQQRASIKLLAKKAAFEPRPRFFPLSGSKARALLRPLCGLAILFPP
jgi:hypothetical protein